MLNSKDMEYRVYTLGDIGVIELLIAFRYKYDENLYLGSEGKIAVSGAPRLNEEIIATYATLDEYIRKCKFDENQIKILEMTGHGYSNDEIAYELSINKSTITGRLNTMYKRIAKENEWYWRKSTYEKKLDLKNKKCSKCKEELPATVEFYSDNSQSRDGFHSVCKICRK